MEGDLDQDQGGPAPLIESNINDPPLSTSISKANSSVSIKSGDLREKTHFDDPWEELLGKMKDEPQFYM